MPLFDKTPSLGKGAWVAPNASVIGDVKIGDKSAVWYGAVLRGSPSIHCSILKRS